MSASVPRAPVADLAALAHVRAVALSGSTATGRAEACSDIDLYVLADAEPPEADRAAMLVRQARAGSVRIADRWFGNDDSWTAPDGTPFEAMHWE